MLSRKEKKMNSYLLCHQYRLYLIWRFGFRLEKIFATVPDASKNTTRLQSC